MAQISTIFRRYNLVDWMAQAYLAGVAIWILFLHNQTVPAWKWLLAGHCLAVVLIHALVGAASLSAANGVVRFFKLVYPLILFVPFYCESGVLNRLVVSDYLDPVFSQWEQWLFGCQPSLELMAKWPHPIVSEPLYAAYCSFYLMIVGVAIGLLRQDPKACGEYVTVTALVMYGCYVCFLLLPVVGPRLWYSPPDGWQNATTWSAIPAFPPAVQAGWCYRLTQWLYALEVPGGAFPSSHVAGALCTLHFSWRHFKRFRYVHLLLVAMLCLATVYCRFHYALDVVGGLVAGVVLIRLGCRLNAQFAARSQT